MSNMQDVINRANTDQQFRARLKADPAGACQEAGIEIPQQVTFEVIERNRNELHLLLGGRTNVPVIDRILERADQDAVFRKQLLSDPKAAVQAATGEKLPATCTVHVRDAAPDRIYIMLDDLQDADRELTDNELEAVAGGNAILAVFVSVVIVYVAISVSTVTFGAGAGGDLSSDKTKN